eukprot:g7958.t1
MSRTKRSVALLLSLGLAAAQQCSNAGTGAGNAGGSFWYNRGSGHPPTHTSASLLVTDTAYVVKIVATNGNIAKFGGPMASCPATPRSVTGETFGVMLARGMDTPTQFLDVSVQLGENTNLAANYSAQAGATAMLKTYLNGRVSNADAWCAPGVDVASTSAALDAPLTATVSAATTPCSGPGSAGGRTVEITVPFSAVPAASAGATGLGEAGVGYYTRAQFYHTYYAAGQHGLPTYTAAYPTFASDNAQPGCYGRPKNFQLYCHGTEACSTRNPKQKCGGLCNAPADAATTFVKDAYLSAQCPVAPPADKDANSYVPQHLWPQPKTFKSGTTLLQMITPPPAWTVDCTAAGPDCAQIKTMLDNAIARFGAMSKLSGASTAPYPNAVAAGLPSITVTGSGVAAGQALEMGLNTSESYSLSVTTGAIAISAPTVYGAMHALTSLLQLTEARPLAAGGVQVLVPNAPWTIDDAPRYPHRGVLVDTSRQWISVDTLKKVIDGCALSKMNVVHWHATDATSFPLELKSPSAKMLANASYGPTQTYSMAAVRELVAYARDRGVRLLPEIDTPGHAYAWGQAGITPPITECDGLEDQYWPMCPEPPCGYLNVSSPKAQEVATEVWRDVVDLFNTSGYVHVGGDEQSHTCWGDQTETKFSDWFKLLTRELGSLKKGTINWAGSVLKLNTDMLSLTNRSANGYRTPMLQTWHTDENKMTAAELGYDLIDSSASHWYLDCGDGAWLGSNVGGRWVGKSWCTPFKTWQTIYAYDPEDGVTSQYWQNLKGGETALWGEQNGELNYEQKLWPRAAAAAERLWSPKGVRDPTCAQERLRFWRQRLALPGIAGLAQSPSPMQPEYCRQHPDMCNAYLFIGGLHVAQCEAAAPPAPPAAAAAAGADTSKALGVGLGLGLGLPALAAGAFLLRNRRAQSSRSFNSFGGADGQRRSGTEQGVELPTPDDAEAGGASGHSNPAYSE